MPQFKVKDTRFGRVYRTGLNGRFFDLEVGPKLDAEQALIDHLLGLGVDIEVFDGPSKGAGSSSEEGSVEVEPVPIISAIEQHAEIVDAAIAAAAAEAAAEAEAAEEAVEPIAEPAPEKAAAPKAPAKKVATKAKKK